MRNIAFASIILATLSCNKTEKQQTPNSNAVPVKIELPNTPETVVRAWEDAVNKNQLNFAQMISIGPELAFVKALTESNTIEQTQALHSEIVDLKCMEQGNETATCNCTIKYDDGPVAFKYYLIRNNGQWMINDVVPEEMESKGSHVNQKPSRPVQ
jgi:hypothetical protein